MPTFEELGMNPMYGDQQAAYTQMRAAFGPYGGMLASGGMGGGMGGGFYGPPIGGPAGTIADYGAMIRPVTYVPPPVVYGAAAGQYIQRGGLGRSIGNAIGWNEPPRNVYVHDFRHYAGADIAERLAGGAAQAGLAAAGLAAGMALAPFGAAAGSTFGAGLGGLVGSVVPLVGTAAGAAAGATVGGVVGSFGMPILTSLATSGMGELLSSQRETRGFLERSSWRYVGSGSPMVDPFLGRGMSTRARGQVAEMLTDIDVKDPFLDQQDLFRILQGATSMGLMNNAKDVDDFKTRFKGITDNLKTIVKTLNTSLEEGLKTMRELRGIGVMDPNTARQLVVGSDVAGRVTGRTAGEMVTLGLQGAEIFRGTGVSMEIGFKATQMNLMSVRAARDANVLSQEAVAQAGGEEQLAQRMTVSNLSFAQSALGRGMMAAFYGGQGGQVNMAMMQAAARGQSPAFPQLGMMAAQNLGSPRAVIEYQAYQEKFLSEMGKSFGGRGLEIAQTNAMMSQAEWLSQNVTGVSTEATFRMLSKTQLGLSEPEIEARIATIRNANKEYQAKQASLEMEGVRQLSEQAYVAMPWTRLTTRVGKAFTGLWSDVSNPINRSIDNFRDQMNVLVEEKTAGIRRGDVSRIDYMRGFMQDEIRVAESGGRELVDREKGRINMMRRPHITDLYVSTWSRTAAENVAEAIEEGRLETPGGGALRFTGLATRDSAGAPVRILGKKSQGGDAVLDASGKMVSVESLSATAKLYKGLSLSDSEAAEIEKNDPKYAEASRKVMANAATQGLKGATKGEDVFRVLTGKKDLSEITPAEVAAVINFTKNQKNQPSLVGDIFGRRLLAGDLVDKTRLDARNAQGAIRSMDAMSLNEVQKNFEKLKADTSSKLNMEFSPGTLEKILVAYNMDEGEDRNVALAGAANELVAANKDMSFDSAMGRIRLMKHLMPKMEEGLGMVRALQIKRGKAVLSTKFNSAEEVLKGKDLDTLHSARLKLLSDDPTAAANLTEEETALLERKDVNLVPPLFAAQFASIGKAKIAAEEVYKATPDKMKKAEEGLVNSLKNAGMSDPQDIRLAVEEAHKGNIGTISGALVRQTEAAMATKMGVTESGENKANLTQKSIGDTVKENLVLQTNLNQEILIGMRNVAERLGR